MKTYTKKRTNYVRFFVIYYPSHYIARVSIFCNFVSPSFSSFIKWRFAQKGRAVRQRAICI